jgi:hypothetical protein
MSEFLAEAVYFVFFFEGAQWIMDHVCGLQIHRDENLVWGLGFPKIEPRTFTLTHAGMGRNQKRGNLFDSSVSGCTISDGILLYA